MSPDPREGAPVRPASRRPTVLQVGKYYPPHYGGIETHLQVLCGGLREHADVRVLVSSDDRSRSVEVIDGVPVERLGTRMTLAGAPVNPGMSRRIRESDADVVHLHLPNPAAVVAYLASGHRGRLVVSYHSDVVRQRVLDAAFRPILRRLLDRADAIVAATPNYLRSSPTLARYRERCHVIPYGIPLGAFERRDAEVAEIRARYGPRIVLGVGRLVYYKGFEHLIEAMREVDGHLLIVGNGPLRGALQERARAAGVADRVTLLGGVHDAVPFYHAAQVFVLPSVARSEAFGIVQIEAMACGRPVVNTSLDSGVPYVSRDGESGITVPPADPRALAGAVGRLLDDAGLRDTLGRAARARVERDFCQEVMVERFLGLYGAAAGKPAVPGGRELQEPRAHHRRPLEIGAARGPQGGLVR
ncbi:MAG TPA: glycosyltransferase [Longimicrobiaceae bacterium]|nr:glycosyltransferase [Longimicrobiaceae bacterium]